MTITSLKISLVLNAVLLLSAGALSYHFRDRIYEKLIPTKRPAIVMLGDSHTAEAHWPYLLNRTDVINSGVGGFTTSHFIWILDRMVLVHKPKICYIEGGGNDISVGISRERTLANVNSLIDTLKGHNIQVVLSSVLKNADMSFNKQVDSLNIGYAKIAKLHGIDFLDINKGLLKDGRLIDTYTIDGIHLKKPAYKFWTATIIDNLAKHKI